MEELRINGLEEIVNFEGTRSEIYNLISKNNPLAIIDNRQAMVKIDNITCLILLKKVQKNYKIKMIWDTTINKQFKF